MTRDKFLKDYKFISQEFSKNISVYWVIGVEKTLGVTYFELDKVSDELSRYFLKTFGDSRFVGVSLYEYFFLPCLILGIWKSGNCFAGIGTQYTRENTLNYLNFLKVKYLITDNDSENYNGIVTSYFYIQEQKFFIWRREVETEEKKVSNIGDICYGIMTSGSTGVSKIIQVPWSCILPNVMELSGKFQVNESDCIFQAAPFTFDPFFVELFLTLLSGCSLMIVSNHLKLNPSGLLKILFENETLSVQPSPNCDSSDRKNHFILNTQEVKRRTITFLQMTPSIFKKWSQKKIKEVILASTSCLKVLLFGGEKFPQEILKLKSPKNKTRIFNIYGITEISCWAFLEEVTHHCLNDKVPLGKPLSGIIYKISNNDELCIGSSTRVCLVDDEKDFLTGDPVFRNSGDLVEVENEKLYYLGRSNQIVKKYGIKINLTRTENLFLSNLIKECYCIFDEINMKLGLFYVPKVADNSEEDCLVIEPQDFVSRISKYPKDLKDIEKPDYLIQISKPPVNEHGKCDRKKLLQYLRSAYKSQVHGKDVRETFHKIWRDVLGSEKNYIYSESFSSLGGNSVLGMEIINKLEDAGIKPRQNFITELLGGGNFESCCNCLSEVVEDCEVPRKRIKTEEKSSNDVDLVVTWKFNLGKCVDATPSVFTHEGIKKIIIGSHSSRLSCLRLNSGDEIWTITLGDRIESGFAVVEDGSRGFVGCYNHFVYCVSVSDGNILWKYQTEDMVKSTPCLSQDERVVYLSSYDKHLYCVSTSEGQLIRKEKVSEGGIYSSGVVSHVLNLFYIATLDGTCIALDTETHLLKWKRKLNSPVFASPCLLSRDSEILFAEVLGIVHCFTAFHGSGVWSYKAGGNIYSSPISLELDNPPLVVFGCHDSHLYCLQSGEVAELKWKRQLDSSVFAKPCAVFSTSSPATRYVCAATTKGFVYLCDSDCGHVKTQTQLRGEVFSSPVCLGNRLSVGCRDDYVYTLEIGGKDWDGMGRGGREGTPNHTKVVIDEKI